MVLRGPCHTQSYPITSQELQEVAHSADPATPCASKNPLVISLDHQQTQWLNMIQPVESTRSVGGQILHEPAEMGDFRGHRRVPPHSAPSYIRSERYSAGRRVGGLGERQLTPQ
ncbi:unnamed protein product [Cutaneotrichosporon oleaginosum]